VRLSARITVGATLEVALTTTNDGDQPTVLGEGLHTYFKIGELTNITVFGLDGFEYVDLLHDNLRCQQVGSVGFDGELDRIYVNNQATFSIEDPLLRWRVHIEKSGSLNAAVWNPCTQTAAKMDDIGPQGWRDMVCVETANTLENQIAVAAAGCQTIRATYSTETLFLT
jgi:glucose-6-phosphate 1-epimerase